MARSARASIAVGVLLLVAVPLAACDIIGEGATVTPRAPAADPPSTFSAGPLATIVARVSTPTPQPTPTHTRSTAVVGNTGGDGVYIRRTPAMADKIKAWPDGTRMTVLGEDRQAEGRAWCNVEDPDGTVGWVPAEYLVSVGQAKTAQAAPRATVSAVAARPLPPTATASPATSASSPVGQPSGGVEPGAQGLRSGLSGAFNRLGGLVGSLTR